MTDTWQLLAECRGMDPELFHPTRGEDTRAAKATCRECVVRAECLTHALANNEFHGIWGGLCEKQRKKLRVRYRAERAA
jgi:WhiB family redox-sensing transcriptional regulator